MRTRRFGLALACGVLVGAGARGQEPRDPPLTGEGRAWNLRAAGAGDYQVVLEVSGRDEVARFLEPVAGNDLQRICNARNEAVAVAFSASERYLAGVEPARDPAAAASAHQELGQLYAHEGQIARAISEMEAAYRIVSADPPADPGFLSARGYLEAILGVLHLRRGELENCIHDHNAARCIFPIRGRGQHDQASGSAAAVDYFLKHLQRQPGNLEARWLVNVAYMTLGRHPGDVPPDLLIPTTAFESADDPGLFVDVAWAMKLDAAGRAGGVVVDDLDNDGRFDVVTSSVDPCAPLRYYRNRGDGTFEERGAAAGLAGQLGGINLVQTDHDNDGWLDLFVMRGGWQFAMRNSLLHNNRDGTFTDVTAAAGLMRTVHRTHSAAWADFDGDGWLDVFVGHEETPAALFRNRGDGTFVDVGRAAGVDRNAFTKGAAWGDYDGDGAPDLYVSNYAGDNFLYRNRGDGTFEEVGAAMGVQKPVMSFPTWFWDYDDDGRLDLFVASFVPSVTEVARRYLGLPAQAETMRLYRNVGQRFEDVTRPAGLDKVVPAMGANFGDLDNDGFLDFYLGTGAPSYAALVPNAMFRNRGGRVFADVTTATGTGHLQKGHGVAFADFDGDGDQDVYANIGGFVPGDAYQKTVFRNPGHGNRWLRVRLVGVKANRAAIGARLRVTVAGEDGRQSVRHREVSSGGSFGASPLTQHIGLGRAARIKTLEVEWPGSRTRQAFTDVPLDARIEIREFENKVQVISAPAKRPSRARPDSR
jgi:hypothetical protein